MQSQGGGGPESRYTMSYSHASLAADGVDLYGHAPDPYVLQHQHHMHAAGMSPGGHLGLGSPGQHHGHSGKRSADVAGLNLKQDPMVGDVSMSSIGMGHSTMDDGGNGGQSGNGQNGAQAKKTPPPNGKKTKGRVKIKMEFIDNKLRRYTTFSKRKTGIMKKAYELSTLTGTQVMLLVASETGHVYTFATRKLQPMITSEAGKALIQTCLNSPDPPSSSADQRMSATGFEETELTYTLHDEDQKEADTEDDENEAPSSEPNSRSPSPAPSPPERHEPRASGSGGNAPAADAAPSSAHQAAKAPGAANVTASQLANLAASLPSLPGLPAGANLATLLASVSASMAAGANPEAARTGKSLPQLISLAHLGVALQQAASAKDAASSAKNVIDLSDGAALDLHNSDKKGPTGSSKSRSRKSKK